LVASARTSISNSGVSAHVLELQVGRKGSLVLL